MAKTTKREKAAERVKTKEERMAEQEAFEVARPSGEEKGVKEAREPVPEMPQKEAASGERPTLKYTTLTQCMKDRAFRTRVIGHLVKKLRQDGTQTICNIYRKD